MAATDPSAVRPGAPAAPTTRVERRWWDQGAVVAGLDEVGRGAWAGPLTIGAVILSREQRVVGLRDSKDLAPPDRERLAARLWQVAEIGIGRVPNDELDRIGLAAALRLAARRAVDALPVRPDVVLIDGNVDLLADYGTRNQTLVRGDSRSRSIAAASIVAKVRRDAEMVGSDPLHPAYRFASNKGYATPAHREALTNHGPCVLHRRSWAPIAALRRPVHDAAG